MLLPSLFRNNFVDDFINDVFSTPVNYGKEVYTPKLLNTDVREFDDKFQLDIELPGYKKEDINAELRNGYLTVDASRNEETGEKDAAGKYIRRERYMGRCQRSFYVGDQIVEDDINAKFENGILRIEIPKKKEAPEVEQRKYIQIEG